MKAEGRWSLSVAEVRQKAGVSYSYPLPVSSLPHLPFPILQSSEAQNKLTNQDNNYERPNIESTR
ncbi:hypothetical protein Cylst_6740 (plasmid) [Cylindrospermum stagnale PCC 7417]|uniref:Uncharacterized protein n=1 Tax=Cylindrospermum stagnale PCC 7417 TaxID=56107 RepID=K9X7K1_9NOST|nr:hypothetical protein Cylst_6740 [Cylindrospermum stagnale PCC 7417]